jgi:membrane-associated phospholipid phosphatase
MSHQFLATVLHLCSATLAPQLLATVLLGFLGHGERVREFLWAAILSIDVTTIIAGLLPAASAPALFGVDPGVARYQDTLIFRGDAPATFTLHHLTGLVSFPSYHAVLAVMLVRAFRGYGWITGAAVAMNIAVIISALVPGGHYLVDLIAGVAVAIVAIIVTRWGMPGSLRARSVSGPGSQSA